MQLIVLRSRALCQSCRSKLPPRTEAWWDESTAEATCSTCRRLGQAVEAPVLRLAPPGMGKRSLHELGHSGLLLTSAHDAEPEAAEVLDRGDMGEGRIGQMLEAARIHGIEVLHGLTVSPPQVVVDHLVIAANGVWVVHAVPALDGKLERRDLGDWFTSDQRLFIADADRSDLLAASQERTNGVASLLQASEFTAVVVRGVLCFEMVQPGWVTAPFVLDGTTITWRRHLVEPMLTPVVLGTETRQALTRHFTTNARQLVGGGEEIVG